MVNLSVKRIKFTNIKDRFYTRFVGLTGCIVNNIDHFFIIKKEDSTNQMCDKVDIYHGLGLLGEDDCVLFCVTVDDECLKIRVNFDQIKDSIEFVEE